MMVLEFLIMRKLIDLIDLKHKQLKITTMKTIKKKNKSKSVWRNIGIQFKTSQMGSSIKLN